MADITGYGTTLAGSTAGTIGDVLSASVAGRTVAAIDVSSADSTSACREFIAGMRDEGEFTIEVIYDGTNGGVAEALSTAFESSTAETWTITYSDGGSHACSGFITSLSTTAPFEDKVTQAITIKLTGDMTYTAAA